VYDADSGKFKRMWGASWTSAASFDSDEEKGPGAAAPEEGGTAGSGGVMMTPEPERKFEGEGAKEWSTCIA